MGWLFLRGWGVEWGSEGWVGVWLLHGGHGGDTEFRGGGLGEWGCCREVREVGEVAWGLVQV